jgi:hypothetical protein
MKIAKLKKCLKNFQGNATLFSLSEPWFGYEHVVVSAITLQDGAETFIFGSDSQGVVLDWADLPGSSWELLSDKEILGSLGYEVLSDNDIN